LLLRIKPDTNEFSVSHKKIGTGVARLHDSDFATSKSFQGEFGMNCKSEYRI